VGGGHADCTRTDDGDAVGFGVAHASHTTVGESTSHRNGSSPRAG
jgi:hypothetical protein